jgi:hypothetical protein
MKDGQTIGQWLKWDFEANGYLVIHDKSDSLIYFESSNGFWEKYEWDSEGHELYYENSDGEIIDNRTPKATKSDTN